MSGPRFVSFLEAHSICGHVTTKHRGGGLSSRCDGCGATLTLQLDDPEFESLADLGAAIEALLLSAEEHEIVTDPDTALDDVDRILDAHPEVRTLLRADLTAADRSKTH